MSLTSALFSSTSALQLHQRSIDVVSRNIANANTPGYSEKSLPTTALIVDGQGAGVTALDLQRRVARDLQTQTNLQISTHARQDAKASALQRLDVALGRVGDEVSLGSRFQNMMDRFINLQATPESSALQQSVIAEADILARTLNGLSNDIGVMRQNAEDAIKNDVDQINQLVVRVDALNTQISRVSAQDGSAPDLEDERDRLVTALNEYIDVDVIRTSSNKIYLNVGNGYSLLDETPRPLSFNSQQVSADSVYTNPTPSPSLAPNLEGLTIAGVDITNNVLGGRIKGHFEVRDEILPLAQAQIDEFSASLINGFEAQGLALFVDSRPANQPFPNPPGLAAVGLAGRIEVNQSVKDEPWRVRDGTVVATEDPNPGNTTIVQAVLDNLNDGSRSFRTTGLGPGLSINSNLVASASLRDYAISITSFQGTVLSDLNVDVEFQLTLRTTLETDFANEVGVNTDEQLASLITLEQAYSASSRVIQSVQQMFDELLNNV